MSSGTPVPAALHDEDLGHQAGREWWSAAAFGRCLARVRVARNLRCADVAARMELTTSRVWHIERHGVAALDVVTRYAEAIHGNLLQAIWFNDGALHELPNTGAALGARLAQIRHSRHLVQADVAAGMGLTKGRISHIEQRHVARLDTVARYAAALGGRLLQTISFADDTAYCLQATTTATAHNNESEPSPPTRPPTPDGGVARRDKYPRRADAADGEAP